MIQIKTKSMEVLSDESVFPRITAKWIREHCRKHGLYQTPHLNEVLYLQHQGFKKIECLEEYTGVKSIWLDHNYLTVIDGLYGMSRLKCLFLQNNSLTSLRGIETLRELVILDVSNNKLIDTNYLEFLPKLTTLYVGNNKFVETTCIQSLQQCKSLNTVDLSRNFLYDCESILDLLKKISQLSVLYLHGNPVVRKMDSYRMRLTLQCSNLKFLDERPIRDNDRNCANAWLTGGIEAVKKEKQLQKDKENLEMLISVQSFLHGREILKKTKVNENESCTENLVDIHSISVQLIL